MKRVSPPCPSDHYQQSLGLIYQSLSTGAGTRVASASVSSAVTFIGAFTQELKDILAGQAEGGKLRFVMKNMFTVVNGHIDTLQQVSDGEFV